MVSRLFSTAGSLISQVGEVLAPQVHTPLEDLRDHWKAVRKFYIDENENDVEAFQSSQLPEHLVSMVSILVEEEATLGDTGPCVEFFLQQKILETLCLLAERDSPTGVRKLVLQTVAILLGDVSLPLLPHMSVHRPVRNLIRRLTLNPQPTRIPSTPTKSLPLDIPKKDGDGLPMVQPDSEFVTLLETLANKLVKDPSLIGFFIDELQFEEGDLLVFQGLLKHLWDPGSVGERARRGAATCLLLPQLPPLKSSSPPSDASLPQPAADQSAGSNANPPVTPSSNQTHMMINWEVFIKKQVLELISAVRKLPILTTLPASNQSIAYQLLENCKNRVSFCSALAKLPKEDISQFMVHTFEEQFLEGTLGPLLLHPNETDTISTTIYLRELLPCFSSPLLDTLLKFLLGDFVGPEHKEEEEVHLLRYTLISRINSQNEAMSIASCRLFSTLIGLHNPQVINNLILRTIQVPPSSSPSSFRRNPLPSSPSMRQRENTLESLQPSITRFLTLFGSKFTQLAPPVIPSASRPTSPLPSVSPNPYATGNSSSDTANKSEESGNDMNLSNLSEPSSNIEAENANANFGRNSGTYTTIGSGFEVVGGGAGYDSYLVDAQHQLTVCKVACKDWPQSVLNAQVPTQPTAYVGLFLEQIFAKLNKVLDQDLDMNLVVTGIFAKLCYYPVLALSLYLLSYQPFVISGVPTLYGTVEKVLQEVESRSKKFVNITACIERARGEMADPNPSYDHSYNKIPNTELSFNPKRYLQGVIVLEEFCKELAAILQAKVVFGIGTDKKGPGRI